jgi:ubiquitin carboxyl-terminal hydrolase L3
MHAVGLPKDWIINECFGLDDDCLSFVPQPAIAVIAVFESLVKDGSQTEVGDPSLAVDFYMKQTEKLDYACGVIACIHSVLNNRKVVNLQDGSILHKYFKACEGKSAEERAAILENMEEFRTAHISFAAQGQSS